MTLQMNQEEISIIKGVRFHNFSEYAVCHIEDFSDDLKDRLRNQLSYICFGASKAESSRKAYSYKRTLIEFLNRYDSKTSDTQMGMIGELLTHILISSYFPELSAVSPYFNMEEKSIKKGFDVILYSRGNQELWITEVKSGELHKGKSANETLLDLLGTAKRDLQKRLNENELTLWENAINGAYVALENKKDVKDAVLEILYEVEDSVAEERADSKNKNVILVASLFSHLSDKIQANEVKKYYNRMTRKKSFGNVIVLSFQKNTYQKVVDFLKLEAQ
ncbi:DUF1837 domain-containing protein [Paenibacillus cellulositrophicus]|uniref:Hachiman antiphage defense system protein HamA n=1 Tax=Paenibacillus cellulositrophicus TaxID=562959 RepID=UPI00203E08FE|nr:Hachiman antiphage defense system protein HamA [Paenibacillus cellulositrophicus]MCM3000508.1 DUF1837 domain-containing protein [Paenibacillus cellulositrophicus]